MPDNKPNYISSTVSDDTRDSIAEISKVREWSTAYTIKRLLEMAIGQFKIGLLSGQHPAPVETQEPTE